MPVLDPRPRAAAKARQVFEVVGVVKDMKAAFEMGESPPAIYFPLRPSDYTQPSMTGITLMVRAVPGVDAIAAVRREISAMDDRLAPFHAQSMPEQIEELMFLMRMGLWIYTFLGVFGLDPGLGRTGRSDRVLGGAARPRDRHPRRTGRHQRERARPGHAGRRGAGVGRHSHRTGRRMGLGKAAVGHGLRRGVGDFGQHVGPPAAAGRSCVACRSRATGVLLACTEIHADRPGNRAPPGVG